MIKLLLIGESHTSPKLPKIGPAINKFRQGDRVKLLTEAYCLTGNETDVITGQGFAKKPSDLLVYEFKQRVDGFSQYRRQTKYSDARALNAIAGVSSSPIESTPLRELTLRCNFYYYAYRKSLSSDFAVPSHFEQYYGKVAKINEKTVIMLDAQASGLEATLRSWVPQNLLHSRELLIMGLMSSFMRSLHTALTIGGQFEQTFYSNLQRLADLGLFDSLFKTQTGIDRNWPRLKSMATLDGAQNLIFDSIPSIRSLIQAQYASSWLSNGASSSIDTLATITGMHHVPEIIAELKSSLGEKLRSYSPLVILTDKNAGIEDKLLRFKDYVKILRIS
ncbi:MAG: hypothetical protein WC861_00790 [Candidatus Micrarchaeia archaeon]|jgi:hypothetical protein